MKIRKIIFAVLCVIAAIAVVTGIAVASFDIDKHHSQIEAALSKEMGHVVKLGGPIHAGFSLKGITLAVKDVSIGNPPWTSRPEMAMVKSFDLKVALLPLLRHHININGLAIENADILIEDQNEFRQNWNRYYDVAEEPAAAESPAKTGSGRDSAPVDINIASLSIKNSQIAIRGDEKNTVFKVDNVTLGPKDLGLGLQFDGSYNGLPVSLALSTNADSPLSKASRPVAIDLTFANYRLTAAGKVDVGNKRLGLDSYEIGAGSSKMSGHLAASWRDERPAVQGTVASDSLTLSDLKIENAGADDNAGAAAAKVSAAPKRMFSDAPLALGGLKTADVNLDLAFAALQAGSTEFHHVKSTLLVKNGHLFLSPLSIGLGNGAITGQINLDASASPARFGSTFSVIDVDLSDIIKMGGIESFLSGKVKADINLASNGNSLHELAGNLNGPMTMISAGGDVITTATGKISAGLMDILAPGSGNAHDGMNCLVARFIAQNGVVKGNGVLIDTSAATAAGFGDIDLRSETINLDFHTKPKIVDVAGLLPVMHIGGTLSSPDVSLDGKGMVQNVGQMLTGGAVNDPVPDLVTQQGQNACAYTLDHPTTPAAKEAAKGGVVQDMAGKARTMLKGLLGNQ